MDKFYVVFGLDGSGKTTLIKNFIEKNISFDYFHFLPTKKNSSKKQLYTVSKTVKKDYFKKEDLNLKLMSYLRIIKNFLLLKFFFYKFKNCNFISDRYIYGYFAQPYPLKYYGSRLFAEKIINKSRQPNSIFFIDTPVEICYSRKPELPKEEMIKERLLWLELATKTNANILDGRKSELELLNQLESFLN